MDGGREMETVFRLVQYDLENADLGYIPPKSRPPPNYHLYSMLEITHSFPIISKAPPPSAPPHHHRLP